VLQKISEITGPLGLEQAASSSDGRRLGATESGRSLTASAETAAAWLLAQPSPEAADLALRTSLRSSLNVEAEPVREGRYPEGKPAYYVTVGCDLVVGNPANIPAAIARIENAMTPATRDQCENWLAMMQAALAGGRRSNEGAALALDLYSGALARYPADVARKACTDLATRPHNGSAWFPALPELIAECDRQASPRQALLTALKGWKPPTEADLLDEEARSWAYAAARADDDAFSTRRSDPDMSSEAAEFAAIAHAEAKRLRIAARQARAS